jgi:hypothetical protein
MTNVMKATPWLLLLCLLVSNYPLRLAGQPSDFNYDEAEVPAYVLPDALVLENGLPVTDAETWWNLQA